jgi:LacI family transcriptional regulator
MNIVEFSKIAGLSTATISRAFHEPGKLRQKTCERVLALAGKHGYYPSASARALVKGRHDTLGLVWPLEVEGVGSIFAQRVLAGFTSQLVANDLDLLLCPVDRRKPVTLEHARRTLQRSRCDAWVLLYPRQNDSLIPILVATRKPVICLMGEIAVSAGWKSVTLDQRSWIGDALRRLRDSGARRVLFLGCRDGEPDHRARLATFNKLAPGYFNREFLSHPAWPLVPAEVGVMLRKERVDAVIGVDDTAALMALQACRLSRIPVPGRMRIIGIDDTPEAARSVPALATYRQPLDEMTECAVNLALGRRTRSKQFKAVFVEGGSVVKK